ncbi:MULTISPECIES: hypothetical protein [unclassified Frigoribacterium]|uniref:hypothetical protein n=1 Tax=unclassified Frigoribacterium TaxID=2627005 RepID=UPI000AC1677A|nr:MULTISPECIES: hypothetical protein [unclassified Frigoribacterium]
MRIQSFESEYSDDVVPDPMGEPLVHQVLDSHASSMPLGKRLEASSKTLLLDAVRAYYFAKTLHAQLNQREGEIEVKTMHAMGPVRLDLMRLAVIAIGTVNDSSNRTRSLHHTVATVKEALATEKGSDARAAYQLVESIRVAINADTNVPLKYVRHMRNKWAGHASMDRDFDTWANAGSELNLPLLEKALETLVNAHADLFEVISLSETAARLVTSQDTNSSPTEAGPIAMDVEWSAVVLMAEVAREGAKRNAMLVVDHLSQHLRAKP